MTTALPLVDPDTPPAAPALDRRRCEELAAVLKALSDPVRLRLFAEVGSTPEATCVCNIPDVGVAQPTVSHHLRKLREAGLVECERRGTWVHYWPTRWGAHVLELLRDVGSPATGDG